MTAEAPTLFDLPPALPKVGSYGLVGATPAKILGYEDNYRVVLVERFVSGEQRHERYPTTIFEKPRPLPETSKAYTADLKIEADTPEEFASTMDTLQTMMTDLGIPVANMPAIPVGAPRKHPGIFAEKEIKILRQVIDSGDQDHHEKELARLLNDGWKIIDMKSCRVKGRHPSMLVVIYLKRWKPAPGEPSPVDEAEAVENVPSPIPDMNTPGAAAAVLTEYFTENPDDVPPEETPEPVSPAPVGEPASIDPMHQRGFQTYPEEDVPARVTFPRLDNDMPATFEEALRLHDAGRITTAELLEFGDRQAMKVGRDEFVNLMTARQEQMPMLNLPVLPLPVRIPA